MSHRKIDSILLIEDNPGDARLLREMFDDQGPHQTTITHVGSMREAEAHLAVHRVAVILLDLGLPDAEGLEAVRRTRAAAPAVPLVVLTGNDDEASALLALQKGVQDYLIKGQIDTRSLLRALRHSIERKAMEDALFVVQERAQVTLNCIGDAVACTDVAGKVSFLNVVGERLTGWTLLEAVGRPLADVLQIVDAAGKVKTVTDLSERLASPAQPPSPPTDWRLVRRGGQEIPIEASIASINDRFGEVTGTVLVFRDVSAARAMAAQMTHSAQHDFLTGLPNRVLLSDRIDRAIALAVRSKRKVAVLFLDLDGFKHINDSLGHPVGDGLLRSISTRLVACVRDSDTVSRQGGDEFVVLLTEVAEAEHPALVARRMLDAVAETHSIGGRDLHVTTSIGMSVYPDDGADAETLIKNADTAMYQAKANGRHSAQFFRPAMNARAVERQSIEEDLRRALERGEFALHYQPKVDLVTGAITGAEALLRWTSPDRGSVSPARFIPVAEDSGLIVPIGNWVLREACRQAQAWIAGGLPLGSIAVNISAMEFSDDDFLPGVFAALDETGLDPRALELELTESVLMKHAASTGAILHALRARGIQLAIDDFGTGYSSLSYLSNFPVDSLKIDQSFVRSIGTSPAIVAAVISMGRSLDLRVVAEGVETREELDVLKSLGCDEAQGYHIGRPVPAPAFARLLEAPVLIEPATRVRTVLIVDDDELVLGVIRRSLSVTGWRVLEARSGRAAIALAAEHGATIDLVLTDVDLPDLDGCHVVARMREATPSLRALYMSGYGPEILARLRAPESVDSFIEKPFTNHGLRDRMRSELARSST